MTKASSFKPILLLTRFKNFKSILPTVAFLIVVSFFIIGGCNNNSGTAPSGEARTIGQIDGVIVPAIKAEFALQMWREGDPDGDIFLNGTRVADLTQAEQDALNSAYQSGFFVSLISPETQDKNDLLAVLGLVPLIDENAPVDLYAVAREFNVSGVRHFTIDSIVPFNEESDPPELRFLRERVRIFAEWAADMTMTTATTQTREDGSMTPSLTQIADSTSYTKQWSFPSGLKVIKNLLGTMFIGSLSDYMAHNTLTLKGWSLHSETDNSDFYYFQTDYGFAPDSTLPRVQPGNLWPCNSQQPPMIVVVDETEPAFPANLNNRGNLNILANNIVTDFNSEDVQLIQSQPTNFTVASTVTNSMSDTRSGGVSYSTEDGLGVEASESVSYSHSTSYSAPAVEITNSSMDGAGGNNTQWNFDLANPDARDVATNTFQPNAQWILKASPATREGGFLNITTGYHMEFFLITCATNPGVLHPVLNETPGSLIGWSMNFPVPPTPPPPTPTPTPPPTCTMGSCPVGQECATDLMPPVCVPQPCDESMTCPLGFDCMNEVCEPET